MTLQDTFEEILALQDHWSSRNTDEMRRRGELIRTNGPELLRKLTPRLAAVLGPCGSDLVIEGRDGTGRKTEIPWIRLASKSRSPGAQDGWYCVFLFHAGGAGFYLSLMHGSTRFINGEYVPRSDEELQQHVDWARNVLADDIVHNTAALLDIDLGSSRKLGQAYEKSSAIALWHARGSVPNDRQLADEVASFASMLRKIYDSVDLGRAPGSVPPEVVAYESAIEGILHPSADRGVHKGQGFGLSIEERRLVELHAMAKAQQLLCSEGFRLRDVSRTHPYDFLAVKDENEFIVEVKGTTSNLGTIVLTANEVEAHRLRYPRNILIVVHSIELDRSSHPAVYGGTITIFNPWQPIEENLRPLSFQYRLEEEH